jgi:hypothetical protein
MLHDIRARTPYATGNLAKNATLIRSIGNNEIRIYVDENIAPYFKYVNNRPTLFSKGRMRTNPNHEYFQHAVEVATENLARKINGVIIK